MWFVDWIMPRLATVLAGAAPTCTLWRYSPMHDGLMLRGPWCVVLETWTGHPVLAARVGRGWYAWLGAPPNARPQ